MMTLVEQSAGLLLDVSVKALLLAVLAGAALAVCRVRSSNVRHRVWTVVLAAMVVLPLLVWVTPAVPLPAGITPAWQVSHDAPIATGGEGQSHFAPRTAQNWDSPRLAAKPQAEVARGVGESGVASVVVRDGRAAAAVPLWLAALVSVYAIVAVVFVGRLAAAMLRARALVQGGRPAKLPPGDAFAVDVTVLESDAVRVPLTVGWRRPVILLPADWPSWTAAMLAAVLRHEQTHVARGDHWITLLAEWNRAVYWFHPVAWFLRRRLATLAEAACDDAVIASLGDRTGYARHLLEVASRVSREPGRLQPAGVAMARTPQVEHRINAILDARRPLARRLGLAGALALVAVAVPLVLVAAGLRAGEGPSNAAATTETKTASDVDSRSEEPAAVPLRGKVVMQSNSQPVAGAEVRLISWNEGNTHYDTKKATTDERGEFRFDAVKPGKHRLAAFLGDLTSRRLLYKGEVPQLTADGKAYEPVTLRMAGAPTIAVHVVAKAGGQPIEGARVRLVWCDTDNNRRTDQGGNVLLRQLTHEVWHVEVQAPGYAEVEQAVNLANTDAARITIELEPGGVLSGTVTDEAGQPLAGAGVSVFPADFRGGQTVYLKTDAKGGYRFPYLPIDKGLVLMVSKDGYLEVRPRFTLADAPGHERTLDISLERRPFGGSVRGTVVGPDGEPIAGATLVNEGRSSDELRRATTDADGQFRLDDVYQDSIGYELIAKAAGFAPQRLPFTPGSRDAPAELTIQLAAGHRIRGRVVDKAGEPLAGVRVYFAHGNSGGNFEFGGGTRTDADGRFTLDSLPDDAPFTFVADGYSEIEETHLPLDGDEPVVVTMQSQGIIRGKAVDAETGEPVSPVNVRITFSPDRRPGEPGSGLSGARATSADGEQFANPDGTFEFGELIRGMPLQVTVWADGYERQTVRRVVAQSAAAAEPVEFRLEKVDASKLTTFSGRVVDGEARPIGGAELRLVVAEKRPAELYDFPFNWQMIRSGNLGSMADVTQFLTATSGPDGRFQFSEVRPGAFIEIAYWGDGVSQGRLDNLEKLSDAERRDLTITVTTPGTVRGTIDRDFLPELSSIELSGPLGSEDQTFYHDWIKPHEDSYEIRNVPPGSYGLLVRGQTIRTGRNSSDDSTIQQHAVEVRSGETTRFDIRRLGRPVTARLVMPEGLAADYDWRLAMVSVETPPEHVDLPAPPKPPLPEGVDPQKDREAAMKWYHEWQTTDEGKRFQEEVDRYNELLRRSQPTEVCRTDVRPDGSLVFADVPVGEFQLTARAYRLLEQGGGRRVLIASLTHPFKVPEMPGGSSAEPVDLGELVLEAVPGAGAVK